MLFTEILNKNRDFSYLYKKGQSVVTKAIVVYFIYNHKSYNRLGITSSKKIGNAVKRNRARRAIRAAYRECEALMPIGFDMVIVARAAATGLKSYNIKKSLKDIIIPQMIKSIK